MVVAEVNRTSLPSLSDYSLVREQCFIGGRWLDGRSGRIRVINPATGDEVASVPSMGRDETREAITAAAEAFGAWRRATAKERQLVLRRWHDLMLANKEDLAVLMTLEQGKPLAESRGEIDYAASFIDWFAEEARRTYGDVIPPHQADRRIVVVKEPVGVCAAITPWNFPAAMITRKAGAALAAGCTMVLKPASATPLSALALARLAELAGVPAGVFNVITGSAGEIGDEMTSNVAVRKLTFTGSTEIGKVLLRQCAGTVKKVSMELGGNAPFIVFDDADLDAAVDGAIASKYRNAGQTCVCANRLYVQNGIYDEFARELSARVAALKVGNGLEAGVSIGPLIDDRAVAKVQNQIDHAVDAGARVTQGGKRHALGGRFFEPTVLVDVDPSMKVACEETFGPVAPLLRFATEAEVIATANDTSFGLASYFYSRDAARAWRVSEALEYGMVGINTGTISTAVAPFGGVKESGLGREGSKYGIEDYLEVKYLCMAI
jgi:succinate-semialdehyde dehydrogenase / glutarate-semialdehyde dehydrogenase